ncbi:cytidylyltransferase domain-containing protein [Paenibacillus sp. MB22_1]|uniref:acylneuraminate cytidylyltransferase family protein n=1 Tax=Paenibacillus sp. MB22_1 TaxID=3383121 RepID=UPI00399F4D58
MGKSITLAIITARGGSKGVPLKNIKPLNGVPLIEYTIKAALSSHCIDEVLVTTDHEEIAKVSRKAGALVPFLRPAELATDEAKSVDAMIHAIDYYEKHFNCKVNDVILLQPTSPLRTANDIDQAWNQYQRLHVESLQSVVETSDHPYYLRDINEGILVKYDQQESRTDLRRQDLSKLYRLNGAIYIVKRDIIMNDKTLFSDRCGAYIMSKENSVDIDDWIDFQIAEVLIKNQELVVRGKE